MPKARRLLTNFSKGELSPKIEGRPDLAAYFEGGSTIENYIIMRQGGLDRRPGTRFVREVKDSTRDTVLLPFESSVNDAFIVEVGHLYMRFYKNKSVLLTGGVPVEVVSPYTEAQLRNIHFTQSVDVMFLFHPDVPQHKLSRISDTNWVLQPIAFNPPATFEADTDVSGGTITLTPGALTGTNVIFLASAPVFIEGDVGRLIVYGASRATITALGPSAGDTTSPNAAVRCTILDPFFNTNPIPAGQWLLRLSPQAKLDLDIKEPVGAIASIIADRPAFRNTPFIRYIAIYGGLLKITAWDSATQQHGEILSVLSGTSSADPPEAPIGSWTEEIASWSPTVGYPRTGEFFQGRLGQASTQRQPTTWWLSTTDDFDNYATGAAADRSIEYTIASRALDRIEWMADRRDLFLGTTGAEMRAQAGKTDEPFGGDVIPLVNRTTSNGSAPIQPIIVGTRVLFIDRSRMKVFNIVYSIEQDGFDAIEITGASDHIFESGVRLGPIALAQRPDPRIYFVREDGTLVTLTFFEHEKVIGFTRLVTEGIFEAVSVIPSAAGLTDQVWVIAKRVINGVTKRYIEMFEDSHESLVVRTWKMLQSDCTYVYKGAATTTISGLAFLEGKTVDVVANGGFIGTKVVSGGAITLAEEATEVEVGLHYNSTLRTMRPAIDGTIIEGVPRSWDKLWLRLYKSVGGYVNNELVQYPTSPLGTLVLYTGDLEVQSTGWDTDGRITVEQRLPYPFTLLALFGTLSVADSD